MPSEAMPASLRAWRGQQGEVRAGVRVGAKVGVRVRLRVRVRVGVRVRVRVRVGVRMWVEVRVRGRGRVSLRALRLQMHTTSAPLTWSSFMLWPRPDRICRGAGSPGHG